MIRTVILLVCFTTATAILWKDCGSTKGKVNSVVVSGCTKTADKNPCMLKKGNNATFSVNFTPNEAATQLTSVVHGIVGSVPVPFPLPNPDGCQNSGLTCPLVANKAVTFTDSILVRTSYPSIKLVVEWELRDEKAKDVFCIQVLAQVTS